MQEYRVKKHGVTGGQNVWIPFSCPCGCWFEASVKHCKAKRVPKKTELYGNFEVPCSCPVWEYKCPDCGFPCHTVIAETKTNGDKISLEVVPSEAEQKLRSQAEMKAKHKHEFDVVFEACDSYERYCKEHVDGVKNVSVRGMAILLGVSERTIRHRAAEYQNYICHGERIIRKNTEEEE